MKAVAIPFVLVIAALAGPAAAQDTRLSPDQIKAAWVGKKVFGKAGNGAPLELKMKDDGTAEVTVGNFYDRGKWRLTETGYCAQWYKLRAGKEACLTVVRRGEATLVLNEDGSTNTEILRIE